MTFIAVPIFVRDPSETDDAISQASRAAEFGADLIEWRIDEMAMLDTMKACTATEVLVKRSPLPSIVTCRPTWEGGSYDGEESHRRELLSMIAVRAIPKYIDLELAAVDRDAEWNMFHGFEDDRTSLILSTHDFNSRPPDLIKHIARMSGPRSCSVIKVAWCARSLRDNLEAFDLLRERPKPMIALCMGPFGLPSRVLAPKFGGFATFASPGHGEETAPGQPTLEELKELYRIDSIDSETRVYGVVGWPVSHSLSPRIHNAGFTQIEHNGVYLPLPIPPEWEHFKATVGELIDHPHLDFRGASVTIPHKQNLIRFVEERGGRLDDYSQLAGAANTLIVGATGAVVGRNTDAPAIVECLSNALNVDTDQLRDVRIAVLGAGGVARAAVAGLVKHDVEVTVFNRTTENARVLIEDVQCRAAQIDLASRITLGENECLATDRFDVYMNCTSVGMVGGPAPEVTPFDVLSSGSAKRMIDEHCTVFETVYAPSWTPLIELAELRGARVILGVDLFLRQAAMQFESWTGEYAPIDVFKHALQTTLGSGA